MTIKKMLANFNFAKESNHKNMLFYQLFKKPIPEEKQEKAEKMILPESSLAIVSGGGKNTPGDNQDVFEKQKGTIIK